MPAYSLLRSGELVLDVADEVLPLVAAWIPLNAQRAGPSLRSGRQLRISIVALRPPAEGPAPIVALRPPAEGPAPIVALRPPAEGPAPVVALRPQAEGPAPSNAVINLHTTTASALDADSIALHGASAAHGIIDLAAGTASIALPADSEAARADAYSMLTLASALLLARHHHALMHAGAVVDPEGRAWLLVGDSHAGKTSTVVALAGAGWSWLADDQVVVSRGESGEVIVEGWPRIAHLDEGWDTRTIAGTRASVDLRERLGARLARSAPLGGVVLPQVRASEATRAEPAHPAAAFSALVRQSPWLMADKHSAPAIAQLLGSIAATRPTALTLGADSYGRGNVIAERLEQDGRPAAVPPGP